MPNMNYQRGYRLEHAAQKLLEANGYKVMRAHASKGETDLMAVSPSNKLLVQCKKTTKDDIRVYDLEPIIRESEKAGAIPLLVYSFLYSPVYAKTITSGKMAVRKDENHVTLEEYLSFI